VVFGGMLSSTLLAIPFVPVFYVVTQRVGERLRKNKPPFESSPGMSTSKDRTGES